MVLMQLFIGVNTTYNTHMPQGQIFTGSDIQIQMAMVLDFYGFGRISSGKQLLKKFAIGPKGRIFSVCFNGGLEGF